MRLTLYGLFAIGQSYRAERSITLKLEGFQWKSHHGITIRQV